MRKWLSIGLLAMIAAMLALPLQPLIDTGTAPLQASTGDIIDYGATTDPSIKLPTIPSPPGRTEVISMRTGYSKTYLDGDTYSLDVSVGAVHYQRTADGPWIDIDATIRPDGTVTAAPYVLQTFMDGRPGLRYTSRNGIMEIRFRELRHVTGATLTMQYTAPITIDNRVIWPELYPDIDLVLIAGSTGVKLQTVIKSPEALAGFSDHRIELVYDYITTWGAHRLALQGRDADGQAVIIEAETLPGTLIERPDLSGATFPVYIDPTVEDRVSANTDDCSINEFTAAIFLNGAACPVGENSGMELNSGFRFQTVNVPNGATITTAYVELTAKSAQSTNNVDSYIMLENTDDAATFSTYGNYWGRATTGSVPWNNIAAWSVDECGTDTTSPSLVTGVKNVVDRGGWAANQDMAVLWQDNSGTTDGHYRESYSHDSDPAKAALLHIEYTTGPAVTTDAATGVTTQATLNGDLVDLDGDTIDYKGYVWDTTSRGDPGDVAPVSTAYSDYWTEYDAGGYSTGAYDHNIYSLDSDQTYYFRAVIHGVANGWVYGSQLSFTTCDGCTTVGTFEITADTDDGRRQWDGSSYYYDNAADVEGLGTIYISPNTYTFDSYFRFSSVTIAKDSIITGAYLRFRAYNTRTEDTLRTKITACLLADATIPTSGASSQWSTLTTAQVNWDLTENWTLGDWHTTDPDETGGESDPSYDVSDIIEEVVGQAGWASGNHILMFVVNDASSANARRNVSSRDENPSYSAELYVEWAEATNVDTDPADAIDTGTATLNGDLTSDGDQLIDYLGFVWDTTSRSNPGNVAPASTAYSDNWTDYDAGGHGLGAFDNVLTGLGQYPYYFRACAHSTTSGWLYGAELSFEISTWLEGFSYFKEITIPATVGAEDDWQIDFEFHPGAGTDSNGVYYLNNHSEQWPFDIQITTAANVPYEQWLDPDFTDSTARYVAPIDGSEAGTTVKVYYGNPSAVTEANLLTAIMDPDRWDYPGVEILGLSGPWGNHAVDTPFIVDDTAGSGYFYQFVAALETAGSVWRIHVARGIDEEGPYTKLMGPLTNGAVYEAPGGWAAYIGRISVVWDGSTWCMYHTGGAGYLWTGIGLATCSAADFPLGGGTGWNYQTRVVDRGDSGDWDDYMVVGHIAWYDSGTYYVAYGGKRNGGTERIGIASSTTRVSEYTKTVTGYGGASNPGEIIRPSGWNATGINRPSHINLDGTDVLLFDGWSGTKYNSMVGCAYNSGNVLNYADWTKLSDPVYNTGEVNRTRWSAGNLFIVDNQICFSYRITTTVGGSDSYTKSGLTKVYFTLGSPGNDVFLAYDPFNAYPGGVELHDSSSWSLLSGSGYGGTFELQFNTAVSDSGTTPSLACYDDATYQNVMVESRVRLNGFSSTEWMGIQGRQTSASSAWTQNGYVGFIRDDGSLRLADYQNGGVLAQTDIGITSGWHTIGLAAHWGGGTNTLAVYWDETESITYTSDSMWTGAGYWGLVDTTSIVSTAYSEYDYFAVRKWMPSGPYAGASGAEQDLGIVVTTSAATSVTLTSAQLNGSFTVDIEDCSELYWVWDTSSHPAPGTDPQGDYSYGYIYDVGGYGNGSYNHTISTTACLTYNFRFGVNSVEYGYTWGSELSFVAGTDTAPTITTGSSGDIEETTAALSGNITAVNDTNIIERGFDVGLASGVYTTPPSWTETGTFGTGVYTSGISDVTGLTPGDTHFWRAKAINECVWGYGSEDTFLTKPYEPQNFNASPTYGDVRLTWTNGLGVDDASYDRTIIRGQIGSYPANVTDGYEAYNGYCTSCNIIDTVPDSGNVTYYRAWSYVADIYGDSQYSDSYAQTSLTVTDVPDVEATGVENVGTTSATLAGWLHNIGGTAVTAWGYEWSEGDGSNYGNDTTLTGPFSPGAIPDLLRSSLTEGALYRYAALALNSTGWGGKDQWVYFMARPAPPNFCPSGTSPPCGTEGSVGIRLNWDMGNGAEWVYLYRNDNSATGTGTYPTIASESELGDATLADGSILVYYGPSVSILDSVSLTDGDTYYYGGWSYAEDSGIEQWSSAPDVYSTTFTQGALVQTLPAEVAGTTVTINGRLIEIGQYGVGDPVYCYFQYGTEAVTSGGTDWTGSTIAGWIEMEALGLFDHVLSGLPEGGTYYYRAAVRFGDTDNYGSPIAFIVGMPSLAPPTNFRISQSTATSLTLAWDRNPIADYTFIYFGCQSGCDITVCPSVPGEGQLAVQSALESYTHTDLTEGIEYCYVAWSQKDGVFSQSYSIVRGVPSVSILPLPDIIQIESMMIVEDYSVPGDQLIVYSYKLDWYDVSYEVDPSDYFYFQILDGTDLLKQTRVRHWGYYPASLYIGTAAPLTWQSSYTARIIGVDDKWSDPPPSTDYSIVSETYVEDITQLCPWVSELATRMQDSTYWEGVQLMEVSGEMQYILTPYGAQIFESSIPGVSSVCTDLLGPDTNVPVFVPATGDLIYADQQYGEAKAESTHGRYIWNWITGASERAGLGVMVIAGLFWFGLYLLTVFALNKWTNHAGISMTIAWLILPVSVVFGGIEMGYIAAAAILAAFTLAYSWWWKTA